MSKKLYARLSFGCIFHRAHFHFVLLALALAALSSAEASTVVLQCRSGSPGANAAKSSVIAPDFEGSFGTFADGFDPATTLMDTIEDVCVIPASTINKAFFRIKAAPGGQN